MSLYDYSVENNEIKIFCVIVVGKRIMMTSYSWENAIFTFKFSYVISLYKANYTIFY